MDNMSINTLADKIVQKIKDELFIEIEASGRHIHLTKNAVEALFGKGYKLTFSRALSQPGQYVCNERVKIMGPKSEIDNVVILGPERSACQVEISKTDARVLGIDAPLRESGDVKNSPGIKLVYGKSELVIDEGVIIAKRHIHITPSDAQKFDVENSETVRVKTFTDRNLIFDDVVIRVSDKFKTAMHIDYDEANACGFTKGCLGRILKK